MSSTVRGYTHTHCFIARKRIARPASCISGVLVCCLLFCGVSVRSVAGGGFGRQDRFQRNASKTTPAAIYEPRVFTDNKIQGASLDLSSMCIRNSKHNTQTNKQTSRQTDKQTNKQTRQTRQTNASLATHSPNPHHNELPSIIK